VLVVAVQKDITEEGEAGIEVTFAIQGCDYKTCQVVPRAWIDIWSSNGHGHARRRSRISRHGGPKDALNPTGTALRGVTTFNTLVPGHYDGRATHCHTSIYPKTSKQASNTIAGGHVVWSSPPQRGQGLAYNTNKVTVLRSTYDFLFQNGAIDDNPIAGYALVASKLRLGRGDQS
jgi:hypothetical protein